LECGGSSAGEGIGEAESLAGCLGSSAVPGNLNGIHNAIGGGINPEAFAGFNVGATDEVPGGVSCVGHVGSFDLKKL